MQAIKYSILVFLFVLASVKAKAIEEDRKNHGPLDGHPVKVLKLLEEMSLDQDVLVVAAPRRHRVGVQEQRAAERAGLVRRARSVHSGAAGFRGFWGYPRG